MTMYFERAADPAHPMLEAAMRLYRESFPWHEQREASSQAHILRQPDYHFTLIYDETMFVGLVLYWEAADFLYVEHFCILPELRGRRYGQRALEALPASGKPVILEIDPPDDAVSVRRRGFYERCGFSENPYPHVHPPYHPENEGHRLVLMSRPGPLTPAAYERFCQYLRDTVMRGCF